MKSASQAFRASIKPIKLLLAVSVGLIGLSLSVHAKVTAPEGQPVQLSSDIRPSLYRIDLTPNGKEMTFAGSETIEIEIRKPTTKVVLNVVDIDIQQADIHALSSNLKQPLSVSYDPKPQTATLLASGVLNPGRYELSLRFNGKIGTQAVGLFALDYNQAGQKQRALFTQFENSDARRLFPSFDEPAFKAKFELSATVDSDLMAVSNMPIAKTLKVGEHLQKVSFQTSPTMSSYLLFFAVGDFERLTTHLGKTELGVVARRGAIKEAQYALEQSKTVLDEYQHYFNIAYPLPKLDNVAAPGQSQFFGAMENWGAIFTFEHALLVDPAMSTTSDIRGVFSTEAHEAAHQWFGDLVTMNWWDDIWLNEGFASWMESRTTQKLHPEWHTDINRVTAREGAMSQDSLASSHPVVQHITTVEEASSAFDSITYQKGSAVIGMLEDYVGAEVWRKGVSNYLRAHAYSNAKSEALWQAIDAVSPRKITQIAHDFTLQPGVPLVMVDSAVCEGDHTQVTLTQSEFTLDRPEKAAAHWTVPVTIKILGHEPKRAVIDNGRATLSLPGCGAVLVNTDQHGYFRTYYPANTLNPIIANLTNISTVDQLGLMSDRWALGSVQLAPLTDYLDLVKAIPIDADDKVISQIAATLSQLNGYYEEGAERNRLNAFAIKMLSPRMTSLGFEPKANEPVTATELRAQLYGVLSAMGDPTVLAEAKRRYEGSAHNPALVPVALRKTILSIVAENADEATWEQLHQAALKETVPQTRSFMFSVLANAKDPRLAAKALNVAISDEPDETVSAAMVRGVSRHHPRMALEFALAHREQVMKRVDNSSLHRFLPGLIMSATDSTLADLLAKDAEAHGSSEVREVKQAITVVHLRASFKHKQLELIDQWLQKH